MADKSELSKSVFILFPKEQYSVGAYNLGQELEAQSFLQE